MITLLVASGNAHKVLEVRAVLGEGARCLSWKDFPNGPTVIEDAGTFAGNATKKAMESAGWLAGLASMGQARPTEMVPPAYVLADDSGLEVDVLDGAPGVFSARFAAVDSGAPGNSSDAENSAKLLRLLKDVSSERRTARFRCVVALAPVMRPAAKNASPVCLVDERELQTELFEGSCEGRINFAPRGRGGFGYDPLFVPVGFDQTFAELGEETKNRISHRAMALNKLKIRLAAMDRGQNV
jgi:XTP/dITP diphosphohydrolase